MNTSNLYNSGKPCSCVMWGGFLHFGVLTHHQAHDAWLIMTRDDEEHLIVRKDCLYAEDLPRDVTPEEALELISLHVCAGKKRAVQPNPQP